MFKSNLIVSGKKILVYTDSEQLGDSKWILIPKKALMCSVKAVPIVGLNEVMKMKMTV